MILDAGARTDDWFSGRTFDACIIGAGPAGVTVARKLGAAGHSVGLFEAGGLEFSPQSQELYSATTAGQPYYPLDGCRLRFFGGTSNHWGGWTRPLDAHDLEPRPHHPMSGWPIAKSDLDPFAKEAAEILNLTPDRTPPDAFRGGVTELVPQLFRFSRPTARFGEKYRSELERSNTIEVYLNANLVDLRLGEDGRSIGTAIFRFYARDDPFTLKARVFVLCLGGIENPRALLNANSQMPAGLGNERDLVGRYFMEHPHAPVGRAVLRDPMTWMLVYAPTPELMRSQRILNFGLRIGDFDQWNGPEFTGAFEPPPLDCEADFDAMLVAEMRGEPPPCPAHAGDVFIACEQSLNPDNRVTLSDERDRFGLRKAHLDWRLSETDRRTLKVAATEAGRLLAQRDAGRMQVIDWLLNDDPPQADQVIGGNHHMGTTRMSEDPRQGVVDADTKVHALDNLYVGGSSVFATSGHANPTYTIVQLALRQAEHLDHRLSS